MKTRLSHVVEYGFVRVSTAVMRLLPYRAALFLGWLVAAAFFYVGRFRVGIARQRLRQVFGDRFSEREINRIAWLSWRNFVFCIVDMIRLPLITLDWVKENLRR